MIREKMTTDELYDQVIEECAELIHAIEKYKRAKNKTNPTPVDVMTARNNITEEYTDLILCSEIAGLQPDYAIKEKKYRRWCERLEMAESAESHGLFEELNQMTENQKQTILKALESLKDIDITSALEANKIITGMKVTPIYSTLEEDNETNT